LPDAEDRRLRSARWCGLGAITLGCLIIVLGGRQILHSDPPREFGLVPAATVVTAATIAAAPRAPVLDPPGAATAPGTTGKVTARPAWAARPPVQLRLERLAVTAHIDPVPVEPGGALAVPANPGRVGWWQSGARPGSGRGSVVIDGHVDDFRLGAGALFDLRRSRPGDVVAVRDTLGRSFRYVVTGLREYPKRTLPAAQVFAQGGPERLVLITCGGAFDRRTRQYADNIVVYALPAKR